MLPDPATSPVSTEPSTKATVLYPSHTQNLVDDGRAIIICNKTVLKLDAWIKHHPGGDKAILHMVGQNATDQINAFHSEETKQQMLRYQIGVIEKKWDNSIIPPIQRSSDGKNIIELGHGQEERHFESSTSSRSSSIFEATGTMNRDHGTESPILSTSLSYEDKVRLDTDSKASVQRDLSMDVKQRTAQDELDEDIIVSSFRELIIEIEALGLFKCNYAVYGTEAMRISCIFAVTLLLLYLKQYIFSSIVMGLFWHQLVFVVHDLGHIGVTHSYNLDTTIGILISSVLGGLSLSWWKKNHNIHHLLTNSPSHDPDIQHLPFLSITPLFFRSLYSTYYDRLMPYTPFAQFMTTYQQYLYYPLLCLGRFNLYFLSWQHVLSSPIPSSENGGNKMMNYHR